MTDKVQITTHASSSDKRHKMNHSLRFCNGKSHLSSSSTFHINVTEPCSLPTQNTGFHQSTLPSSSVCGYRYRKSIIQHQRSSLSEQIDDPDVQVLDVDDIVAFCHGINISNDEQHHTSFDLTDLRLRGDEIRVVESSPLSAVVNMFSNGEHISEQRRPLQDEMTTANTQSQNAKLGDISEHVNSEVYSTTAPAYVQIGNEVESFQSIPQSTEKWSTVSAPAPAHSSSPFWSLSKSRSKRRRQNEDTTGAKAAVEDSFRKGSIISMLRAKFQHGRNSIPHGESDNVVHNSNGTPVSGAHTTMSSPSANMTRSTNRAKRWHWRRLFRRMHLRHSFQNDDKTATAEGLPLSTANGPPQREPRNEQIASSSPPEYDRSPSSCTDNNSSTQDLTSRVPVHRRKPDYNRATMLVNANLSSVTSSMVTVRSVVEVENSKPRGDKFVNILDGSPANEITMNTETKLITTKATKYGSPVLIGSPAVHGSLKVNPKSSLSAPSAILKSVSDKSKHLSLPITPEQRHVHDSQAGVPHSFCGSIQSINISRSYVDRNQRKANVGNHANESTLALAVMPDRRCKNGNGQYCSQRGRRRLSHEASSSRVRKNIGVGTVAASSTDSSCDESRRGKVFGPRLSLLLLEGLSSLELKNKAISSMVKNMRRMGNGGNMFIRDESSSDLQSPWGVQNEEADDSNVSNANLTRIEQFKKALKIGTGTVGMKKKITDDDNDDICSTDTNVSTRNTQRNRNCSGAKNSEDGVDATNSVFEMSCDEFVDFITSSPSQNRRPKWTAAVGIKK